MSFLVAMQEAIDHMVSDEGWGMAGSYADAFSDRLWNELPVGLEALDAYAGAIARAMPSKGAGP